MSARRWTEGHPGGPRLDADGVAWFACDPYPTWYRKEGDRLIVGGRSVRFPEEAPAEPGPPATCDRCGLERTDDDAEDYSPMQIVLGEDPGWYSSDDEDFCGPCITEMIRRQ